jgi:hypothetical protein
MISHLLSQFDYPGLIEAKFSRDAGFELILYPRIGICSVQLAERG